LLSSRMAAKDDVTTMRRTAGAERATALRIDVVPMTAGSTSSRPCSGRRQPTSRRIS